MQYMKVENEIYRSMVPKRITFTARQRRRLVAAAKSVGPMLKHLATIAHPGTIRRWIREEKKGCKPVRRGRKRKPFDLRELVIKLARENIWGFDRIVGELKKLNAGKISKNTVKRILKAEGIEPSPLRETESWDEYLRRHKESLWQCDFITRKVVTMLGLRDVFVLVFIHVKTRQVILTPATLNPNEEWVLRQTEEFVTNARGQGLRVGVLQHDRDKKFTKGFRKLLARKHVDAPQNAVAAPKMNAFVERFIQSIQRECLDHFILFGTKHLDSLNREYLEHFHEERPHQSLGNRPILKPKTECPDTEILSMKSIQCRKRLSGLLKSYSRKAA